MLNETVFFGRVDTRYLPHLRNEEEVSVHTNEMHDEPNGQPPAFDLTCME